MIAQAVLNAWLTYDTTNGWQVGHVVERLKDARALGAYHCVWPGRYTFWRVIQYEGMGWGYDWESELRDDHGWRSDWPDLVRLEWKPLEGEALTQ